MICSQPSWTGRLPRSRRTEHGMYEPSMKDLNLSEEGEVLS